MSDRLLHYVDIHFGYRSLSDTLIPFIPCTVNELQNLTVTTNAQFHYYRISRSIRRTVIFSLEILEKNNDECTLILVIYWKKTGLLHTKISNHNIIYLSWKPRKLSLPLKSSSWLFSPDAGTGIYKFGNNTYPRRKRCRSNLGHIFRGKKCVLWAGSSHMFQLNCYHQGANTNIAKTYSNKIVLNCLCISNVHIKIYSV